MLPSTSICQSSWTHRIHWTGIFTYMKTIKINHSNSWSGKKTAVRILMDLNYGWPTVQNFVSATSSASGFLGGATQKLSQDVFLLRPVAQISPRLVGKWCWWSSLQKKLGWCWWLQKLPAKWKIGLLEVDCWKQSILLQLLHWLLIDSSRTPIIFIICCPFIIIWHVGQWGLTFLSYICLSQPKTKNDKPVKLTTGPWKVVCFSRLGFL